MYMVQNPPKYDDVICEQPLSHNHLLSKALLLFSWACSIPLETTVSSVIVTGGWIGYGKKVTRYIWHQTLGSSSEDWPQLLEDRAAHACGKYMDSNNKNVRFRHFLIKV